MPESLAVKLLAGLILGIFTLALTALGYFIRRLISRVDYLEKQHHVLGREFLEYQIEALKLFPSKQEYLSAVARYSSQIDNLQIQLNKISAKEI